MSLRRHPSSIRFQSELVVANRIIVDMGLIQNFFNEYADTLRKAGLRFRDKNVSDTTVAIKEELEYMVLFLCIFSLLIFSLFFIIFY
jgi:hypothetical protein